jgi:hypothetical protein
MFLLYHSDVMFEIFPKSWFLSPEQVESFRQLASRVGALPNGLSQGKENEACWAQGD